MPCQQRSSEGRPVRADLLEAGLDTGFALLRLAAIQSGRDARRSIREAAAACKEGERRIAASSDPALHRYHSRFAELRRAIAAGPVRTARVLQMPAIR